MSKQRSSLLGIGDGLGLAVGSATAGGLMLAANGPRTPAGEHQVRTIQARSVVPLQGMATDEDLAPLPESPAFGKDGGTLYWVSVFGHEGHSLWTYDLKIGHRAPIEVWEKGNQDCAPGYPAVVVHRDGPLYAADFSNEKVTRIDSQTGESTDVITAADVDTESLAPDDLVFDPGGDLFISDMQGGIERCMQTTNMVIEPGTRRAFLVAGGTGGAFLYEFRVLANGVVPFSHS